MLSVSASDIFSAGLYVVCKNRPASDLHYYVSGGTYKLTAVADLEGGGRAGSAPPPFGEGLTPSLTVLCDNGTVLWRHHLQFIFSNT